MSYVVQVIKIESIVIYLYGNVRAKNCISVAFVALIDRIRVIQPFFFLWPRFHEKQSVKRSWHRCGALFIERQN